MLAAPAASCLWLSASSTAGLSPLGTGGSLPNCLLMVPGARAPSRGSPGSPNPSSQGWLLFELAAREPCCWPASAKPSWAKPCSLVIPLAPPNGTCVTAGLLVTASRLEHGLGLSRCIMHKRLFNYLQADIYHLIYKAEASTSPQAEWLRAACLAPGFNWNPSMLALFCIALCNTVSWLGCSFTKHFFPLGSTLPWI